LEIKTKFNVEQTEELVTQSAWPVARC